MANLIFTNAMDLHTIEGKRYEEPVLSNFADLAQLMMNEYDMTHKTKLNIVLFKYLNPNCIIIIILNLCF